MSLSDLTEREISAKNQKCTYILNLIKMKDKKLHKELKNEMDDLYLDDLPEFLKKITDIYRSMQ